MDPERWRHIEELYHATLEHSPETRQAFLAGACRQDADLRREVESLLAQPTGSSGLLDAAAWQATATPAGDATVTQAAVGAQLGPYRIEAPLGAGGMGQVFKARDTRLGRAVAIKVVNQQFNARFEREARAISSLNHPHICTLYDVGPNYLVMELVEGETLSARLEKGPLPLAEVLRFAVQIAEALVEAHSLGIIHRDLKPGNIMITRAGIKVLDFGLAKFADSADAPTRQAESLTVGQAIVGTPAYMAPEQVSGEQVDARSDLFSFGAVLYEMATGRRAFPRYLDRTPPLPMETNSELQRITQKALATDRALRYQTAAEVVTDLRRVLRDTERLAETPPDPNTLGAARQRRLVWGAIAALVLVGAGLAAWFLRGREAPPDQMLRPVPLTSYLGSQDFPSFSPDGSQVAFAWDGEKQDNFDIYVKRIGPGPPLRLTHDPAADRSPAWSPDGSSIAFLRASQPGRSTVVLIPPLGGPERVVSEVVRLDTFVQCLTWSPDSKWLVVFDRPASEAGGLWLLSVETGERRRLTTVSGGFPLSGDAAPGFAPDGRALAFVRLAGRNAFDLYLLSLGEDLRPRGEPRRLTRDRQVIGGVAWTSDGRELVFSSGAPGNLSLFRMAVSGEARPRRLTEQGEIASLTISERSKGLVFVQTRREMDIYRVELGGHGDETHGAMPLIASSRWERFPRYSADGKKIAFVSLRSGNWQLWVSDSDGANPVQMTSFERGEVALPSWAPDGRQIGFTSNAEGSPQAYVIDAAGGKPRKVEALGTDVSNWQWSRDGRWIIFLSGRSGTPELWKMPAGGGALEQLTRQGAMTPVESRDGKLVYYAGPGGLWSVPVEGGEEREVFKFDIGQAPIEADQRGIYFVTRSSVTRDGDLMFYRLPNGPITRVAGVETGYGFSVSPDGRYLLYTKMTSTGSDLMLVENFR